MQFTNYFSHSTEYRYKKRYLSNISSSSKGSSGRVEEIQRSSTSNRWRSTIGENIIRKFHRYMDFFLAEGGSCSYNDEIIDDIKFPLRYKHLVK